MSKFGSFAYFLIFLFKLTVWSQPSQPFLKVYTSLNGLSVSEVNNVQSDITGFLWIATNYGLNKFDGNHFTRFYSHAGDKSNGLLGNTIKQVLTDSLVVWVAIDRAGIACYFDRADYFINYIHDPGDRESLVNNSVNRLHLSSDKRLFVGTDSGMSILNRKLSRFENIVEHPDTGKPLHVTSFAESSRGTVWIATNKQGLLWYDKKGVIHSVFNLPHRLSVAIINDLMYNAESKELWLATSDGVWCASEKDDHSLWQWRQPFLPLKMVSAECIRKNADGDIWVGTTSQGIYWQPSNGSFHHFEASDRETGGLVSNCIRDIFFSKDGNVWLSSPAGLLSWHKELQQFPAFKTEIKIANNRRPAQPYGLALWKKYLVAATHLGIWTGDTGFLKSYSRVVFDKKGLPVHFTNTRVIDEKIFLTSSNGVYQLLIKGNEQHIVRPAWFFHSSKYSSKPSSDIIRINDDHFWISADDGIYSINTETGKTDTVLSNNENSSTINSIRMYQDKQGRILAGTGDGITIFSQTGSAAGFIARRLFVGHAGKKFLVNDFYDDYLNIWIAVAGEGFFRCDKKLNILNRYTTNEGLCDNNIFCIERGSNGDIWLTTSRGLSVFDTASKVFSNYYHRHGLTSHEFKPLGKASSAKGTLYFSTTAGIVSVYPDAWKNQTLPLPQITITKASIADEIMTRGSLTLINQIKFVSADYGDNISLSFAVADFLNIYENSMQYKLEAEGSWLDMHTGSEILFDRLGPGTHQLYVRAIVKEKKSASEVFTLSIRIDPVYYQQWWFIPCVILLLGTIIFSIYRYKIGQLRKLMTIRTKISQDLHDEVGATLSGISMYSHLARQQVNKDHNSEAERSLDIIQGSAVEMVNKLNDIVWFVNPQQDSLKMMVEKLNDYATSIAAAKNILVKVTVPEKIEEIKLPMEIRRNIYLICKEAINNAVKYSDGDLLELKINEENGKLEIAIRDNGKGFDAVLVRRGNGLENMQKRADEIGAKLILHAKLNEGALVSMQCKITR